MILTSTLGPLPPVSVGADVVAGGQNTIVQEGRLGSVKELADPSIANIDSRADVAA
jgi:hypothetical protein